MSWILDQEGDVAVNMAMATSACVYDRGMQLKLRYEVLVYFGDSEFSIASYTNYDDACAHLKRITGTERR